MRSAIGLPDLASATLVYIGRHHYRSRRRDGYLIADMVDQLVSGLAASSRVLLSARMTALQNPVARTDRYGNIVHDRAVLELTAHRPDIEVFSAMPKGRPRRPGRK